MTRRFGISSPVRTTTMLAALLLAALGATPVARVHGERPLLADELPAELDGVGIVQRLNEKIPMDATFRDETGRTVKLGELFSNDRPVILTLNFFRCEMLCTLTLNGLVDAIRELDWSAGTEFDIVTVSIAPEETPELAEVKKRAYLGTYRRETADAGWHFLTGEKDQIDALCKAVGFGYRRVGDSNQFAHSSSIIFITSDGRISRYMNDIQFESKDVRLALVEASQGKIGSPIEHFLLFTCFKYDPEANSYAVSAVKVMRLAGVLTIFAIGCGLIYLWIRGAKAKSDKVILPGLET